MKSWIYLLALLFCSSFVLADSSSETTEALLKHFGSVDRIRQATVEELRVVVPEDAANSIKAHLE